MQLEAHLRQQRDDILLDAAVELEHLEAVVDRDEPVAELDDGMDPALAAEIATVRAALAEIEREVQRLLEEEGRQRAEIQRFRSDKEIFKAGSPLVSNRKRPWRRLRRSTQSEPGCRSCAASR